MGGMMLLSVCLWKVRSRVGFTFLVILLIVSHRACFRTACPCAELVSSVNLSVSGGWGTEPLLAVLTLYFLLISSIILGMAPLTLKMWL